MAKDLYSFDYNNSFENAKICISIPATSMNKENKLIIDPHTCRCAPKLLRNVQEMRKLHFIMKKESDT